jgi:hypothetical protein
LAYATVRAQCSTPQLDFVFSFVHTFQQGVPLRLVDTALLIGHTDVLSRSGGIPSPFCASPGVHVPTAIQALCSQRPNRHPDVKRNEHATLCELSDGLEKETGSSIILLVLQAGVNAARPSDG